jgi:serine/threonine protein kinase
MIERVGGYRIVRRLATGGTSDVLLAKAEGPHGFERLVVLKLLLSQFQAEEQFARMFAREASAYARLSHPAIVKLYDFFEWTDPAQATSMFIPRGPNRGQLVMVLEYVDGLPLSRLRSLLRSIGHTLDDRAAIYVMARVFAALSCAHGARDAETGEFAPVIHRDVNPSNVLIPWDGHVKLGDFGIAKVAGLTSDTKVGLIKGTFGYMAPEQVKGENVSVRADVYAGTLLLWELLARRKAIQRGALPEVEVLRAMAEPSIVSLDVLRPDLDATLREAIRRGLEPSADKRAITAEEMLAILKGLIATDDARARLVDAMARVRPIPASEKMVSTQSPWKKSAGEDDDGWSEPPPGAQALAPVPPAGPPPVKTQPSVSKSAEPPGPADTLVDTKRNVFPDEAPTDALARAVLALPDPQQPRRPAKPFGSLFGAKPAQPADRISREPPTLSSAAPTPKQPPVAHAADADDKTVDRKAGASPAKAPSSRTPDPKIITRSSTLQGGFGPIPPAAGVPAPTGLSPKPATTAQLEARAAANASGGRPISEPPATPAMPSFRPNMAEEIERVLENAPTIAPAAAPVDAQTLTSLPATPQVARAPAANPAPPPAAPVQETTLALAQSPVQAPPPGMPSPLGSNQVPPPHILGGAADPSLRSGASSTAPLGSAPPPGALAPPPVPAFGSAPPLYTPPPAISNGAPVAFDAPSPPPKKSKSLLWLGLFFLLVAASGTGVFLFMRWRARNPVTIVAAGPSATAKPSAKATTNPDPTSAATPTPTATATATPTPTPTSSSNPMPGPSTSTSGTIKTNEAIKDRRVWVDGKLVGQTPDSFQVPCGSHEVRVGSAGKAQSVDVPCGGEVSVK